MNKIQISVTCDPFLWEKFFKYYRGSCSRKIEEFIKKEVDKYEKSNN